MNPNEEMRAYLNNDMDITKMSYAAIDNIRSIQSPLAPSSFIIKKRCGDPWRHNTSEVSGKNCNVGRCHNSYSQRNYSNYWR